MNTTDREYNFDAILLDRKTYQLYINAGRMMADKIARKQVQYVDLEELFVITGLQSMLISRK